MKICKTRFGKRFFRITLHIGGEQKYFLVHRLVALTFISNTDNKPAVNHKDGHKLNNFVGNLEWVTSSENQRHAVATGLAKSGSDRSDSKLTNEQVVYIRNNPDGLTGRELAKKFGVCTEMKRGIKID